MDIMNKINHFSLIQLCIIKSTRELILIQSLIIFQSKYHTLETYAKKLETEKVVEPKYVANEQKKIMTQYNKEKEASVRHDSI